jgi:hypothetical protein
MRTVHDAASVARGFRINAYPTLAAKSRTSSDVCAAIYAAVGTPASRSTSFIDGLSRHR